MSGPAGRVHFTVPGGWRPIGAALAAELKTEIGNSGGSWTAAYEAGPRQKAADLTGFRQFRDQVLTLDRGVHGVRETYDYTDNRTSNHQADTWDMDAMTDAGHTVVFILVVHCTTACYGKYQAEITHLMSSVTASRLAQPTGPFTGLIGR